MWVLNFARFFSLKVGVDLHADRLICGNIMVHGLLRVYQSEFIVVDDVCLILVFSCFWHSNPALCEPLIGNACN